MTFYYDNVKFTDIVTYSAKSLLNNYSDANFSQSLSNFSYTTDFSSLTGWDGTFSSVRYSIPSSGTSAFSIKPFLNVTTNRLGSYRSWMDGNNSFTTSGRYVLPDLDNNYTYQNSLGSGIFTLSNSPRYVIPSSVTTNNSRSFGYSNRTSSLTTGSFVNSYSSYSASRSSRSIDYSYKPVDAEVQGKLGPEFLAKVKEVARNINCDYKDLLAVMNAESGLNPAKKNGAGHEMYGLIQFSADSARAVGTTHAGLIRMSAVEQMDYVEKYYKHWIEIKGWQGRRLSAADLYALTLAPGRAQNEVLYSKAQNRRQYDANKKIDTRYGDGDGKIDRNDCNNFIASFRVDESIFA